MVYEKLIRKILFSLEPEKIHEITIGILSSVFAPPVIKLFLHPVKSKPVKIGNLEFRNPLGLAAGMDKNAVALKSWDALGFGFAETGTVTPLPQEGNQKPRIFRLPEHNALINRLGFNNCGADRFTENLKNCRSKLSEDFIVGVNIGKGRHTELDDAFQDYKFSFERCYEYADYFTINVSSPNTEGLRQLQQKKYLTQILSEIQKLNSKLDEKYSSQRKDIFLKVSPDITYPELDDILDVSVQTGITGIVATNTTVSRSMLPEGNYENGGLSGKPLEMISNQIIQYIVQKTEGRLAVIGCGGIFSYDDAKRKLDLGASLLQVYTGLVYQGPGIVKEILKGLN
jgi:dihydroorotate dehydrogenase